MISIIIDGLVLLGLISLFDRKNPNRDFLKTGLVALLLVIAYVLTNRFLMPAIGFVGLVPYSGLCVFLLWKLPEIPIRRAILITAAFVAFKVMEPWLLLVVLASGER